MNPKSLASFLAFLLVMFLLACLLPQSIASPSKTPSVRIAMSTAQTGSSFYAAGIAVTQLWVEKLPGTRASASSSSGSRENVSLLVKKETNMGIVQSNILSDAYYGKDVYAGKPHPELRILASLTTTPYHILARKGSHITRLSDAKGKRVCVGLPGSGNMVTIQLLFKAIGMTFDDIKVSNVSLNESLEALRNGLLDMTIVFGQYPFPVVIDALASPGANIELVSFSTEEIEKITRSNRWIVRDEIPANTYKGQTTVMPTLSHNGFISVTADFPEQDAYLLTKTLYENTKWLYSAYKPLDCYSMHNPVAAAQSTGVPFHPGAEKALKELGLK